MIANVRVVGSDGDSILVTANFAVHRMRYESVDTYIGHYDYKLVRKGNDLRIRERRAILDNEALRPHGKIRSFCNQPVRDHRGGRDGCHRHAQSLHRARDNRFLAREGKHFATRIVEREGRRFL